MPSFDVVDYSLRPNKNVFRKLMLGTLQALDGIYPIGSYRYVGMGSMWFTDFVLFHRALGLSDMISIERHAPDRAAFNKPFDCVTVEKGETTKVLPDLSLEEKKAIVWLDFDSPFVGSSALDDLDIVSRLLPAGSVLVVTVNAVAECLDQAKDADENDLSREEALRGYAANLVPTNLGTDDLSTKQYPALVARILRAAIRHSLVSAGRSEKFHDLFGFTYKDGQRMLAVGGLIDGADSAKTLADNEVCKNEFVQAEPFEISVPLLTPREKAKLDQHHPRAAPIVRSQASRQLGFKLRQPQLDSFHRFYRHYPLFGEIVS